MKDASNYLIGEQDFSSLDLQVVSQSSNEKFMKLIFLKKI